LWRTRLRSHGRPSASCDGVGEALKAVTRFVDELQAGIDHGDALDPDGRPLEPTSNATGAFSEMALYVLVRRNDTWWLAAGQNTPVRLNRA
jgi:hypothetical protein